MNSIKKSIAPTVDALPISLEAPGRLFDFIRGFIGSIRFRALVICALVFIVYSPIIPGNFIMDDHRLVKDENALVTGEFNPGNIWFQTDFPLSAVAWWAEWRVWGGNPGWYHAVNMLLHAASALLLWRVLERLKIPGAWLAGALFAVHPVCVNSVARIAEIKNTLSLPFFLLSLWAYLRYDGQKSASASADKKTATWYAFSLIAFVLALFSKTSTVMLPVLLLGYVAWQRRRIAREDVVTTIPFFILSAAFGLMSIWFQKNQALASAGQALPASGLIERFAIVGNVVWFYLGKVLLPLNLNIVYGRWKYDPAVIGSFIPMISLCVCFAVCWRYRASWGRAALFGLGGFMVLLFPALGFFDAQFQVKWQVSDHLQYLPMIAPVTLTAAALAGLLNSKLFRSAGVACVLMLAVLTYQRAQIFSSEEKLYRDTLAKNPNASDAHNDLGIIYAQRGDLTAATAQFSAAAETDPNNASAHLNLARALAMNGDFYGAESHFVSAIQLQPAAPGSHKAFADMLSQQGRFNEAIKHLQQAVCFNPRPDLEARLELADLLCQAGRASAAIFQYHKVLAMNPDLPEPLNNLAWLLATSPDAATRNGTEAVQLAEHACQLTGFKQMMMVSTLAAAYAEAGRFPEAISVAERVIKSGGDAQLMDINHHLLELYRAGKAYHQPSDPDANTELAAH